MCKAPSVGNVELPAYPGLLYARKARFASLPASTTCIVSRCMLCRMSRRHPQVFGRRGILLDRWSFEVELVIGLSPITGPS